MASHLLPFLFLSLLTPTIFSDINADRASLLRLRAAVRGRTLGWNTTTTTTTPCSWEGVKCDPMSNRVVELRLPGDGLSGEIPANCIGNLTKLRILSLRHNSLSGALPSDLGSCTELRVVNLAGNEFSGEVPASFFVLTNLLRVNLAGNKFSGGISDGFNNLTMLRTLYLENNNFSGSLPDLKNLLQLNEFNVSFNRLTGSIPSSLSRFLVPSFLENSLCGVGGALGPCPHEGDHKLSGGAIAGIVIGSVIGLLVLSLVVFFVLVRKCRTNQRSFRRDDTSAMPTWQAKPSEEYRSPRPHDPIMLEENDVDLESKVVKRRESRKVSDERTNNNKMVFFGENFEFFSLEDLLKASAEILGKGFMGTTYKAYLSRRNEVVVKRLKNVCVSEKEFRERVEELGGFVHENLVPLRAYYYGRDEKLLVYESMPISLSTLLHGDRVSKEPLTWVVRSRIALGAASGIEYLHSLGSKVSHGNIKSSNILLTEHYDAYISEYGTTQLVSNSSTSDAKVTGYCAPEVTDSRKVSQKADVYSFGVVLLELLTGKNPSGVFKNDGIDLPSWVKSVVEEKWTIEVFDPELLRFQNSEEQMVPLLHLAIFCTSKRPERRPSMAEITRRIKEICR